MTEEQNKFLTKLIGNVWHEKSCYGWGWDCSCDGHIEGFDNSDGGHDNTDFSEPDGFFELWNWSANQLQLSACIREITDQGDVYDFIDPELLAEFVYDFYQED